MTDSPTQPGLYWGRFNEQTKTTLRHKLESHPRGWTLILHVAGVAPFLRIVQAISVTPHYSPNY